MKEILVIQEGGLIIGVASDQSKAVVMIGETYVNSQGLTYEIIDYKGFHNCVVRFQDGTIIDNCNYYRVKIGYVKNHMFPSIYGVGFFGDVIGKEYNIKSYRIWFSILARCYSEKTQEKQPTYKGCSVMEEWFNFQVFAKWFEENYIEGFHLDKDILFKGNKIYSPETCCFVPQEINTLFVKANSIRGKLPIGVVEQKGLFHAAIHKNNKSVKIGCFKTPEEAFQAYKTEKEKYIKEVADKWRNLISDQVYQVIHNYEVEITD